MYRLSVNLHEEVDLKTLEQAIKNTRDFSQSLVFAVISASGVHIPQGQRFFGCAQGFFPPPGA